MLLLDIYMKVRSILPRCRMFLARMLGFFRRRSLDRQFEEEMRFHLDMEAEANRRRGMTGEEASWAARRAFGGVQQIQEIYRERSGLPAIEVLLKDVRYGFRTLRRSPGFTVLAVLSLALGIGANTAIFTLIDTVMLRSLPVQSPGELVSVGDASRPTALWEGGPMLDVFSYPLYKRLRDQNQVFTGLLASGKAGRIDMSVGNGPHEEIHGRLVSSNYFEVLGVLPALGRTFSPEDRTPGASSVIVLSYDYWKSRFAGDSNILGRKFSLNGFQFTVIGVGPPHFTGEVVGSPADIWIPLSMQAQINPGYPRLNRRDSNWLLCMGRLRPGVSVRKARAEITLLGQEALIDYEGAASSPNKLRDIRSRKVDVQSGGTGFSWIRKHDSPLLFTLMGMVGIVLLIACANVASFLLVRGAQRQKELSMRLALGASRSRLIRQLLAESALLATIGAITGLLFARWGTDLLSRLMSIGGPNPIPFEVDVHPSIAVLTFTASISLLTAVLIGLVPALRSTRRGLTPALKGNGYGRWRLGKVLVAAQLALSIVLLVGAGLFARSFAHLESLDVGYSRHNLLLLGTDLAGSGYAPRQRLPLARRLIGHLRSIPGVLAATVSENGIFSGKDSTTNSLGAEGFTPSRKDDSASSFDQVGPHYFQVVGVPLLAGRDFDEHDTAGARAVAIINKTMARFYFGDSNPVGKYIANGNGRYTIVGVVQDMKEHTLKGKAERRFYLPLLASNDNIGAFHFEIRTRDDAAVTIGAIRREMRSFDPHLILTSLEPATVLINQGIGGDRLVAQLSGFFGTVALLLAATGLYGVISYETARRSNEIALRIALGAERNDVIRMILRDTLTLMAAGVAIGLPAALVGARLIAANLFGIGASDPATLGGATLVLLIAALLAGFIPAARASHIDPMAALRQE